MIMEQHVIQQLTRYRDIIGRMRVLESYSVGNGITVSRLNEDDHLQELHRKLRNMPSYMYLSKHEQQLEATAHAYLASYPAGTRSQFYAVKDCTSSDDEERVMLEELQRKIRKVIEARTGTADGYEALLEQLAEYQDLKAEKKRICDVMDALGAQHPQLARLLQLRYVEELSVVEAAAELGIARRTFDRRRAVAIQKYIRLQGLA